MKNSGPWQLLEGFGLRVRRTGRFMKLGRGVWDRIKLGISVSLYAVLNRFHLHSPQIRARIAYRDNQFHLTFQTAYDLLVVEEVLLDDAYDFPYERKVGKIVDLGANIGVSVAFFKGIFPHAEIRAFEPDPRAFAQLAENTKQFEGVSLVNAAADAENGRAALFARKGRTSGSSLIPRSGFRESGAVPCLSMDSILSGGPVDLVKFDIEGAELRVFAHCTKLVSIRELVGEVHLDLIDEQEFFKLFESFDVTRRRMGPDRYILHMVRKPSAVEDYAGVERVS